MSTIEKSIDVNVPVRMAYNQWTQFEEFPRFMEGIEEVHQLDDKHLHWRAEVSGKSKEWDSEIIEQIPDERIMWRSTSGAKNAGTVSFIPVAPHTTRVKVELVFDPVGLLENVGDMLGMDDARVEGDLERFKEYIESRGTETGAWPGTIKSNGT